jgi:hypothetical protein
VVASARAELRTKQTGELGYHRIFHSHDATMNTQPLCFELDELWGPMTGALKESGVKPFNVALLVLLSKTCGGELCSLKVVMLLILLQTVCFVVLVWSILLLSNWWPVGHDKSETVFFLHYSNHFAS